MTSGIRSNLLIVSAFALFVCFTSLAGEATEKMTVTSSSEKAIELYYSGRDMNERLRRAEAASYFERSVAEDSGFAMAWFGWATTADNNPSFRERLSKAMSLAGRATEAERLLILATDAALSVEPIKRRRYLRRLVNLHPNDERAHAALGNLYFDQQDLALAIESYNRAININSQFSQPYNQLGYCYRQLGNYEKAEETFKRYIALIPDDPNPYDSYAELMLKRGKFAESIKLYEEAISLNPKFIASYLGVASNYTLQEQYDSARYQYQRILNLGTGYGDRRAAITGLLVTDIYQGNADAALERVRERFEEASKASDVAGESADLGLVAGILYETGHYDEALMTVKKALRMVQNSDLPDETVYNAERNMLLAEALYAMKTGDFELARSKTAKYEQLVKNARMPAGIRIAQQIYGMIALETNKYDLAIERLGQSNQQNPYNLFRLAEAYEGAGDRDKARELYRRVVNFNPVVSLQHAFVLKRAKEKLATF